MKVGWHMENGLLPSAQTATRPVQADAIGHFKFIFFCSITKKSPFLHHFGHCNLSKQKQITKIYTYIHISKITGILCWFVRCSHLQHYWTRMASTRRSHSAGLLYNFAYIVINIVYLYTIVLDAAHVRMIKKLKGSKTSKLAMIF